MGCATSTERRCRHCQAPLSPDRPVEARCLSPQLSNHGSNHVVVLRSSTLGSLNLDLPDEDHERCDDKLTVSESLDSHNKGNTVNALSVGLIEAKTWSNMINEKITKVVPTTPVSTPPGEPEMINEWELMEGLEDEVTPSRSTNHVKSFSFDVIRSPARSPCDLPNSTSPVCSGGIATEFDPGVVSSFKKSLQELSPDHPFHTHSSNSQEDESTDGETRKSTETVEFFSKQKVVLYFTSLRGVRKTYEDCCHVRVILKGIGVRIDERDVSMHSGFKDEIAELLVDVGIYRGELPRIFLGRKYIGGADEVKKMHDEGELEKALKGCERADDLGDCCGNSCEACGDVRFVPCETCSGSRKVYCDDNEAAAAECGVGAMMFGFQRCPDCNENGLIRCPICCY